MRVLGEEGYALGMFGGFDGHIWPVEQHKLGRYPFWIIVVTMGRVRRFTTTPVVGHHIGGIGRVGEKGGGS